MPGDEPTDPRLELAQLLLRKAQDDLIMATLLAEDPTSPGWGIGFHAQQAVEKAIKAILCRDGIEYPRTHNVAVLLDLLAANQLDQPPLRESLALLTPFGVLLRYDELGPTEEELQQLPDRTTLPDLARSVVEWAQRVLAS